jgi:PAS domain S-box-containing protein
MVAALFVVLACLLVFGVHGWRTMGARQQQLAETKASASNLARAVSQHANDTLRVADTALITIVQRAEADGLGTDRRESMHQFLMRLTHEIPLLDKLTVMDKQGRWLMSSQQFMRNDLTSEFREYFIYHRDNRSAAAFVGPPLRDRTTGAWVVTLSRRINSPSGQFAGVAVASISLAYFQRFHDRFDIGNNGAIILMLAEGKVLTRRPAVENLIGKHVSDRPLYRDHLALNSEGSALLTPQQDGIERIYGYVRLTDFPLIAVAALGKEEVLQPWRSDTFISTVAVTGLVLLLQFLGFRLVRQIRLQAKTESALAASEFRWKNALESTGDVVWDLEHRNGTVKMSKEWAVLMGYAPDDPGHDIDSFNNLVHPEDRRAALEKLEHYLRGETSEFANTQRVRTRDSEWKWLLTRGMVVARDAKGRPLRTLGTHTDISEQKAQEEKLRTARDALEARVDQRTRELRHNNALLLNEITERRRAEQALQESELRWKFALEGAGDGIWDWDIPGRLLHTSRRWRLMLGYGDEEATESIETWREHIHPDDVERVSRMALDAARGRIPAYHAELRRRGRNGAWTWVLDRGTVVSRDARGKALRMIGTTIDITERKEAALELSRTNRALKMLGCCNDALMRSSDEATLLQQVCNVIREVGGYRMAWVGQAEQDTRCSVVPVAHAGDDQDRAYLKQLKMTWSEQHPGGRGPAGKAIRSAQPCISGDLLHDPDYANDPVFAAWLEWAEQRGYRSVFCLPLRDKGRAFGVLAMYSEAVQQATAEETRLLQELADNLAYGMVTLRAQEERRRMQAAVLKIAAGVSSSTGKQFFEQLCRNINDALHAQAALAIRLHPDQPGEAATVAAIVDGELMANCSFGIAGSPCDSLLQQGAAAGGMRLEGRFPAGSALEQLNGQSCMGALLENGAGEPIGMLLVLSGQAPPASDFGISTLRIFAARAAMGMEREEAAQRIGAQASLLDKAQDAIIVRELNHGIHFWNDGAARLYGWRADEAIGKSIASLLYADPRQFNAATDQVICNGEWRGEIVQQRRTVAASPSKDTGLWCGTMPASPSPSWRSTPMSPNAMRRRKRYSGLLTMIR